MSLPVSQEIDHASLVRERLGQVFDQARHRARAHGAHVERLWEVAGQTVLGGKLVRPLLLLDTWQALAPGATAAQLATVVDLGVAVEVLHYSFLLHDDVIDADLLRRGRENLIGVLAREAHQTPAERAMHWAHAGGILMGDLLVAQAHQSFARADLPHDQRLRLLDLLDHTVVESITGEYTDVGLADGMVEPELGTILAMTRHKTATYTFELPLRMAAVVSGACEATEHRLGRIGAHLGLAYQLQDDLASAFGDPGQHGKDEFSDLREAKQTAIIAHARTTTTWPQIEALLGLPGLDHQQARHLSSLLTDCGAQAFVEALVDEQFGQAQAMLHTAHADLPRGLVGVLSTIITRLRGRQS